MKRTVAIGLWIVMLFMAAMPVAGAERQKIVIIPAAGYQSEEKLQAAKSRTASDADIVITVANPKGYAADSQGIAEAIASFARDPQVRAVIVCQPVAGVAAELQAAGGKREDMLLIALMPQDPAGLICAAADIVMGVDSGDCGSKAVDIIQGWHADVLVHYSYPRHMEREENIARYEAMEAACGRAGITFLPRQVPDPTGAGGERGAVQFVGDDLITVLSDYPAKRVAFFATDCSMQEPLQKAALAKKNVLYPMPCCAAHPYPGFAQWNAESGGEMDHESRLSQIAGILDEKGALQRFSGWAVDANEVLLDAGIEYASKWVRGEIPVAVNTNEMKAALETADAFQTYTLDKHKDAQGITYDNFFTVAFPSVDFSQIIMGDE